MERATQESGVGCRAKCYDCSLGCRTETECKWLAPKRSCFLVNHRHIFFYSHNAPLSLSHTYTHTHAHNWQTAFHKSPSHTNLISGKCKSPIKRGPNVRWISDEFARWIKFPGDYYLGFIRKLLFYILCERLDAILGHAGMARERDEVQLESDCQNLKPSTRAVAAAERK